MARGSKPGEHRGGRKRGVPNKDKQEVVAKAQEIGVLPLDYMLMATKRLWEEGDITAAGDMASKAAPYIHRKMPQAIEQKDTTHESWEQLLDRVEREKAELGKQSGK